MRNLGLRSSSSVVFADAKISAVAIDLEENATYVASDRRNADANAEIEIWKIDSEIKGLVESPRQSRVTLFTSNLSPTSRASQLISFNIVPDSRALCAIVHGGDIMTIPLDSIDPIADVVGSVDFGILAASWSPDVSLLALVTGDNKLILMTSTFDVISEAPLQTSEFGEDPPINVGWGSKQTQFHGSLGKSAAQEQSASLDHVGSSPDDDQTPRISWRGDGAFFVVSSLSPEGTDGTRRRRVIRVYDREAALQSTSEPIAGLEHVLAWKPSGNLIASTQRFGFDGGGAGKEGRHDVVFFERNGLRHGEFALRMINGGKEENNWNYKVRELSWSSDSNVLAVWVEDCERDIVQLWTTANYHWYLKQEIISAGQPKFTSVNWHPENGLQLVLTTATQVIQRTYGWETWVSATTPPNDTGSVAVLDGANVLLTAFRLQNIPPPMSSYQLSLLSVASCSTPVHAAFSSTKDVLSLLWESGYVEIWDMKTLIGPTRGTVMDPTKLWEGFVEYTSSTSFRRVAISIKRDDDMDLVALGADTTGSDVLVLIKITGGGIESKAAIRLPGRNGHLAGGALNIWQDLDGQLFSVDFILGNVTSATKFSECCSATYTIPLLSQRASIIVGLTNKGKLHASDLRGATRAIASNANSFTVASSYLIYTTTAHEVHLAPVEALSHFLSSDEPTLVTEKRRVERGSRIVTTIPSIMTLVLQMPRGNLESINPRPLVLEVVRQAIDAGDYRKAFLSCRKHRVDLNILVEHNPDAFFQRLPAFLEQIDDVDYINLFLTSIGRGSQPPDVVSRVCDSVRSELERKDLHRYINSILTTYVLKTPSDHEAGLSLLLRLRKTAPSLVENAVKYIIFLVDADSLFDLALGMYDFSLVLLIAQHAQKDPREYLPFLRELRAMEKYYQRFRIDDHLKRHEKALWNLSLAGPERFDEAMTYVEKHQLYEPALSIWKGTDDYQSVLNVYGDWLFERREFSNAASVFVEAGKPSKVMIAYERALEWQELFDFAIRDNLAEEDLHEMGMRVAEDLSSKKRYAEAARVFLDYTGDVYQAMVALVQGNLFAEARRIATLHSLPELLAEIIYPGALESKDLILEEITEMKAQLCKQVQRIRELRIRKFEEPDAFYGCEDVDLHNIDIMTDVSMAPTAFTRYTVAPSTTSKKSRQTSRSRRKAERKVGSGKKGTIDEEEYLLQSITKLAGRLAASQVEAGKLLPHMLQFTEEHRHEGSSLQSDLIAFQDEFTRSVDEVWTKTDLPSDNSEVSKHRDAIDKVPKPGVVEPRWRVKLWEVKGSQAMLNL